MLVARSLLPERSTSLAVLLLFEDLQRESRPLALDNVFFCTLLQYVEPRFRLFISAISVPVPH